MDNIENYYSEKNPSNDLLNPNQANVLGSPRYSNFLSNNYEKIENMREKIESCGNENVEFVNKSTSEIIEFPVYCNNRSCDNEDCKEHRLYLCMKNHFGQIEALSRSIDKPLGWVFTGWKMPIEDLDRDFCRQKLKLCFNLLKEYSRTPFSVHMEIKVYRKHDKNGNISDNYGKCYLHFHVVSGGIKNLKEVRRVWGRQIKYEVAIFPNNLGYYVSKYASKTPVFDNEVLREYYHCLVYKTQMHRYSIKKIEIARISNYIPMDLLRFEVKGALYRDSYFNPASYKRYFHEILERKLEPPPYFRSLNDFNN